MSLSNAKQIIPANDWAVFKLQCSRVNCTKKVSIFEIEDFQDDKPFFCSEACEELYHSPEAKASRQQQVARDTAPMIKPQPKGTKVDGWDV